ncbi:MAG: acyl-CoA/acyl-ACP dehydrogenase [Deltaproteobacteria bacterium]|nr:acyl-CoA/acyl-ACP dehydrogenase [Deltaproteobacteria bacterium]
MALDFGLTVEQEQLKRDVAAVGRKYAHLMHPCDEASELPHELYLEMGNHKWMGPFVPEEYGGMGKGAVEFALITEEISRVGFNGHNPVAQLERALLLFGVEEQKRKYLPSCCDGTTVAAVAISEESAGSNWDRMETVARKEGDRYVLNGRKAHINYGEIANILLIYAKTDNGISVFLVDTAENEGLTFKKRDPIGLRMEPLADIYIKDCVLTKENLIGQEGQARDIFFASFNLSRIGNASRLLGICRGAMETAIEYAKTKDVGDSKVTDFQGLRWLVAELYAKIEAATLMSYKAAWKIDQNEDPALEVAYAKLLAGNIADEVTCKIFSLTGGWGLYRDKPFEKFWRDVQVGKIGGGSLEVLRNFIARRLLGKPQGKQ